MTNQFVQKPPAAGATGENWVPEEDGSFPALTTDTAVSVGVASVSVLAANANRRYALFTNDSDTIIYLRFGQAAALSRGIRLNANGGTYEMSKRYGSLTSVEVFAISSVAAKNLMVLEG